MPPADKDCAELPRKLWPNADVRYFNVTGVEHFDMVSDASVIAYLKEKVLGL